MARYFAEKTEYFYEFTMKDEKYPMVCYFTDKDEMFVEVSKRYAFDDCEPFIITKIMCEGDEVRYNGWEPGMVYTFTDSWGEVIWSGCFPEWDH